MHNIKGLLATLTQVLPKFLSQTSHLSFKLALLQSSASNAGNTHSMILINLGYASPLGEVVTPEDMYHII